MNININIIMEASNINIEAVRNVFALFLHKKIGKKTVIQRFQQNSFDSSPRKTSDEIRKKKRHIFGSIHSPFMTRTTPLKDGYFSGRN